MISKNTKLRIYTSLILLFLILLSINYSYVLIYILIVFGVLSILETDFIDICQSIIEESLHQIKINFSNQATVCKYAVPEEYPDNPVKNKQLDISKVKNK